MLNFIYDVSDLTSKWWCEYFWNFRSVGSHKDVCV